MLISNVKVKITHDTIIQWSHAVFKKYVVDSSLYVLVWKAIYDILVK